MNPYSSQPELTEKCAVFGAYGIGEESARVTFFALWALQHRGQESSGIVSSDGQSFYRHHGAGLVASVYSEEDLSRLAGSISIGHNRYSTSGGADNQHCQPVIKRANGFALAHNGNLPTTDALESFFEKRDIDYSKLNDSEMMTEAINCFINDGQSIEEAIKHSYPLFEGAFSCVAMTNDKLIAFRDKCGIRPLSIGRLGNGYVIASETCAFDAIGAKFLRQVKPGEMVVIDKEGIKSQQIVKGNLKLDIFELVYFARPDSVLEGMSVAKVRYNFGKELAREWKIDADIVVPVPDSSIHAAMGYSRESGIPFEMGLIKNRYIHRTFIRPSKKLRQQDLKIKLNPIPELIKGKRVILVDDSIVRGMTLVKIAKMVYDAGAKEVHVLISSPPVKYPDFYGIDTPHPDELVAAQMSVREIQEHIGVDSLGYLSYNGMIRATGRPASSFSTSCFNGVYPIKIGGRAEKILELVHN